jgi:hypothetical protein
MTTTKTKSTALACRYCGSTIWRVGLAYSATETADYRTDSGSRRRIDRYEYNHTGRFVLCAVCKQTPADDEADAILDRVSWDVWVDDPSSAGAPAPTADRVADQSVPEAPDSGSGLSGQAMTGKCGSASSQTWRSLSSSRIVRGQADNLARRAPR